MENEVLTVKKIKSKPLKMIYYAIVLFGNMFVNKVPSRKCRLLFYRILGAKIGKKSVLCRNVDVLYPRGLFIGNNVAVGWHAELDARGGVCIGNNTNISSHVKLITGSHNVDSKTYEAVFKPISIGDFCWIGTGATILQGCSIGDGAVVAAGAVVTKSVPPYTVVGGIPAKKIKDRPQDLDYTVIGAPFLH